MASKDFYPVNKMLHLALKLNAENQYNELDSDVILDRKIRRLISVLIMMKRFINFRVI